MKNLFLRVAMTLAFVAMGFTAFAQSTVKGTVKDAAGEAIIGAAVQVAGTHNGAVTDIDGSFTLPGVYQGDKLEVSCIGYAGQTITWNGGVVNFVLEEDAELLEGTVVTALGIRKDEKKVGYAVSSVSAESLNATVAPSLGSALYGKASGVRISTAPGGATGAISIQVRGISTITGSNQPLIIVDGVPIRNGDANNGDYWAMQRIQSNGLADINVEDIENLTILKGASATSLYGSEGANGVVLITMKQGKRNSGIHVEFGASIQGDFVAYMPKYQTVFGPGGRNDQWASKGYTDEGFFMRTDKNGNQVLGVDATNMYYGPKYDGRQVYYFDGTMRPYTAITDNPWADLFRTGFTQQYNVAITAGTDKGSTRFSYTFFDNLPNQYNSHIGKHNFALSGSQNITANGAVKIGYSINYMNQNVKNRPYRVSRLTNNFSGMFGAFDDIAYVREHAVTPNGYRNRRYSDSKQSEPAVGWAYDLPFGDISGDYLWRVLAWEQLENNQRLIASVTPSWEIVKGLTLKGNIATDYTAQTIENKEPNDLPLALGNSGYYGLTNNTFTTIYGDIMATYSTKFAEKFGLDVVAGYSARSEKVLNSSVGTDGGLTVENWFHLNASKNKTNANMSKSEFLKQAIFGTVSFSYDDWAFLEGTIRNETVSTLAVGNNSYWYPSVNGSIILSELFNMPAAVDFAKFRASYGVVGNAPAMYKAAMVYTQKSINQPSTYTYNMIDASLNNNALRPETTYEFEVGLEGKFFKNRLGFDLAYYNKRIKDQILQTTAPMSSGGSSIWMNVGELQNQGIEFNLYGTVVETRDWRVDLSGNLAWNTNKVIKLADGLDRLQHRSLDGGAVFLYSDVGKKMGDLYSYAPQTDANGNRIVGADGFYKLTSEPVKVGNALPDLIGGFSFSVSYKRFTLDANFNFQIGGDVVNTPYEYMMGRGTLVESLYGRDAAHGGVTYYFKDGACVPTTASSGPNGERVWDNGLILPGVNENGQPNTTIINADKYYHWTYNWGVDEPTHYADAIFKNTYLKCREITLTYALPEKLTKGWCQGLKLSVFARNPFYIYKNLPIWDAEASDSTGWTNQAFLEGSTNASRTFGFSLRANF
jgi:TonB-linked SusC/RagA family outer membrane protein